ncbi:MAG: helix-turn-helix transcriptional regulator [Anaerolineaceae bacterium]
MTQVFVFGDEDNVRVLEIPQTPEQITRTINQGNWEVYLGSVVDRSCIWQAAQAGNRVIITHAQTLPDTTPIHLTPRENQVLQLLSGGFTAAQAAYRLHLDVRTVRGYITDMKAKFHAQTSEQVLAKAVALGMVRPDLNDLVD